MLIFRILHCAFVLNFLQAYETSQIPTDGFLADAKTKIWIAKKIDSKTNEFQFTLQRNVRKISNILLTTNRYSQLEKNRLLLDSNERSKYEFLSRKETSPLTSHYLNEEGETEYNGTVDFDNVLRSLQNKLHKRPDFSTDSEESYTFKSYSLGMEESELGISDTVYPEILIFFDKTLFVKFDYDAVKAVAYVLAFWNTVDLRYRDLEHPNVRINIAGIVLCQDQIVPENPFKITKKILHEFGTFLYCEREFKFIEDYDVAVLMGEGKGFYNGSTGVSFLGEACSRSHIKKKVRSSAVILDNALFFGIKSASHELGHILGTSHDGDEIDPFIGGPGAESCLLDDGYLMGYEQFDEKQFYFSPCSKKSLSFFFSRENSECLRNNPAIDREKNQMPRIFPGQYMSLDQQCQNEGYTGAAANDASVCLGIVCYLGKRNRVYLTEEPALEGTLCGTNSYCFHGDCINIKEMNTTNALETKTKPPQTPLSVLEKSSDQQCTELNAYSTHSAIVDCVVYCINYELRGERFSYSYDLDYAQDGTFCGINGICRRGKCLDHEIETTSDSKTPSSMIVNETKLSLKEIDKLADKQCKNSNSVSKVITVDCVIFCTDNEGSKSTLTVTIATDGFPCRDIGICHNGQCVNNNNANMKITSDQEIKSSTTVSETPGTTPTISVPLNSTSSIITTSSIDTESTITPSSATKSGAQSRR